MSRVVDPKIFDEPRNNGPLQSKYPYDLWTNGQAHQLIRGEDWSEEIPIANIRIMLAKGFRIRGFQIRSRKIDDDTLVIQAINEFEERE